MPYSCTHIATVGVKALIPRLWTVGGSTFYSCTPCTGRDCQRPRTMMYRTKAQVACPSALRLARIKLLGVQQIPGRVTLWMLASHTECDAMVTVSTRDGRIMFTTRQKPQGIGSKLTVSWIEDWNPLQCLNAAVTRLYYYAVLSYESELCTLRGSQMFTVTAWQLYNTRNAS